MRIHVLQVAYGDDEPVSARRDRVAAMVREQRGADLVVLPELWAPGGFSYQSWQDNAEPLVGPTVDAVAAAAREIHAIVHAGSFIEQAGDGADRGESGRGLWNTSVLLDQDGAVVASYRKIHRFGFKSAEPRLLEAGQDVVTVPLPGLGEGAVAGLSTCYDLRFPELYRRQVDDGARLFVVPAAWPAARVETWSLLARARAVENQCFVVAANTAGTHAGQEMGGHSAVVGPRGEVLGEAGTGEEVLVVDVDLDDVTAARDSFPVLADRRL